MLIDLHKQLTASGGILELNLSLKIELGSFNCLYGPSGVGKTSSLRMIAGLMKPDGGKIVFKDTTWFDPSKKVNLKPAKRNLGFVFQDIALFPNMTVAENIKYAAGSKRDSSLLEELLEISDLKGLENQKPGQLSGGQQKRAALIRAIAQQPDMLLLDEPFVALDAKTRSKLQDYLADLHRKTEITIIMVSHDLAEVCKLADTVWQLDDGKLVKSGTPAAVFNLDAKDNHLNLIATVVAVQENQISLSINGTIMNYKMNPDLAGVSIGQRLEIGLDLNAAAINHIKEQE